MMPINQSLCHNQSPLVIPIVVPVESLRTKVVQPIHNTDGRAYERERSHHHLDVLYCRRTLQSFGPESIALGETTKLMIEQFHRHGV